MKLELFPAADASGKVIIPMQFFGLGDIIFCITIARKWQQKGYRVIWPCMPDLVDGLNRAYPDITFADYHLFNVNWNKKIVHEWHGATVYPLRWSYEITKQPFTDCMRSKYTLFGLDCNTWKEHAMFSRQHHRERSLIDHLGIGAEPFVLVNKYFGTGSSAMIEINVATDKKIVQMRSVPGYSLFDWVGVLEMASEVHSVSTSLLYIVELLKIPTHFYIRRPMESSHKNYDYLLSDIHYLHN